MFLRALLLLLLVATPVLAQVPAQMQEVPLNTGWNLISVQVAPGGGYTPAQIQSSIVTAAGTPVASLLSAWNFNAPAANWLSFQATNANYPHDLTTVLPGSGYWIQVNQACFLRLTNSPWQGAVQIRPGWNLVSFPGLRVDSAGLALEAVFRDKFSYVQQVWKYDSSPARRRYVGYDTTARPPAEFDAPGLANRPVAATDWILRIDTSKPANRTIDFTKLKDIVIRFTYTYGNPPEFPGF